MTTISLVSFKVDIKRAASQAVRAGLDTFAASVAAEVPAKKVETRKSVRVKQSTGATTGIAGVIFRRPYKDHGPGSAQSGVGISNRNIHWLLYGTDHRYTRAGKYRGKMPGLRDKPTAKATTDTARVIVQRAWGEHKDRVIAAVETEMAAGLSRIKTTHTTLG